ncbi:MAG: tetratricopeptide repeat protein [Candidatus Aminicenantes bacterium]|nr:tetratricopeptide repeat protein [Candidatus Aminicenantes bacterium]
MTRSRHNVILVTALVLAVAFTAAGCGKLKVSRLKANYHFSEGNKLFKDGKYRDAITEYERAVELNSDLGDAYRFLGESYKSLYKVGSETADNKEKAALALDALKKAYELTPENKDVIFSLGDMYDKLRRFEEAESLYLRILELEPGNMENYYVVAEFYKKYVGERPELKSKAESMYLRRIETDPENIQGYAYLANYYDQITPVPDFDKALEYHKKRLELQPESAELWYTIGVNRFQKAYRMQNFLPVPERKTLGDEAENALLKAIEIDENYPEPYAYLKILYINVHSRLYPERAERYKVEADRYGEKFTDIRGRQLERMKLERELKKAIS